MLTHVKYLSSFIFRQYLQDTCKNEIIEIKWVISLAFIIVLLHVGVCH